MRVCPDCPPGVARLQVARAWANGGLPGQPRSRPTAGRPRPPGHCRRLRALLPWAAALTVGLGAADGEAQFLSRNFRRLWANEVFENYGAAGYRDYDFSEENRRFDFFGDHVIDGVDVISYSETRRDAPGVAGSFESRNARYDRFFDKLIIAQEGFGPWSTRLIVGDHIRTFFTPMTLNLPSYNGVRWDGSSRKSRFSVLATNLSDPVLVPAGAGVNAVFEERRSFGTALVGGHWESQIGDILRLGTTYVNTHRFDAEASARVNSLRGTVPGVMQGGLRRIYVFFTDDQPNDRNPGALVHGLTLFADGQPVEPVRVGRVDGLLGRLPVTADLTSTILLRPSEVDFLRRNRSWLQAVVEASNQPFFKVLLDEVARPARPATPGVPLEATDTDAVFYEYAVPDGAGKLEFEAVVANDYSVDVVGAMQVPVLAAGAEDYYYDWYNALRAEGQPRGGANLRRVRFRYGFPTGLTVLGADFDAGFGGLSVRGEVARSLSFYQAPVAGGQRSRRRATAFHVNLRQELHPQAEVGLEVFGVPHDYTTAFPIFAHSSAGPTVGGRLYQPSALVEDNDDLDQWPDHVEHDDRLVPYGRSTGEGNGVFPGLDRDNDGFLDFDLDNARGADAQQPFLAYFSEPLELVWGDDLNNNGVADLRENDNLPDYPYPADHRGAHGFLRVRPTARTEVRLGVLRVRQEALGGRDHTRYVEGHYRRDWEGLGYVRLHHRLRWVADDILNPLYNVAASTTVYPDLLQNRDSVNNLTFWEWGVWAVPGLEVRNVLSLNRIDLGGPALDDPLMAQPGAITLFAMSNRMGYAWQWGRWRLLPQFKHLYQYRKYPERQIPDSQARWVMPILRLDYRLGPHTLLRTGTQGLRLPLLRERSTDTANPERDFRRSTYTAFIQNQSNYRGYDLSILMGLYRTRTVYTGSSRPAAGTLEYFLRIYIG
ncbi:MAG: hypothetical protein AB1505_26620 [Candidatus Latescibacterota bacterium]